MVPITTWIIAARPKTLVASFSPVLIALALALSYGVFHPLFFLLTCATALAIQIGTNFANDYYDFIKGADTSQRKGPLRATQAGLVSPLQMKHAFILTFALAALMGSLLIWQGGWVIAALLGIAIALGVLYTGGPYPLAYLGLGELFAFLFFGPIATAGAFFLQTHTLPYEVLVAGFLPGAYAAALVTINNVRDIEEDRIAHKKTLAVRFGKQTGKGCYLFCLLLAQCPALIFMKTHPFLLLSLLSLIPALPLVRALYSDQAEGSILIPKTAQLQWLSTLLFCIGWML